MRRLGCILSGPSSPGASPGAAGPVRTATATGWRSRFSRLAAATVLRRYPAELRAAFLSRTSRLIADDVLLRDGNPAVFPIRPAPNSPRTGGMASDGDLLLTAFEAGRAAVHEAFGDLANGPVCRAPAVHGWP